MSDGFFTCGVDNTGAGSQVTQHFTKLNTLADKALTQVFQFANQLGTYTLPTVAFTIDPPSISDYAINPVGGLPVFAPVPTTVVGAVPTAPTGTHVTAVSVDPFNGEAPIAPNPSFAPAPTAYSPTFAALPTLNTYTAPTFGDRTQGILAPTLRTITILPSPVIDWASFNINPVLPTFTAQAPDPNDFRFTPDNYQTQIADQVKPVIQAMLNGQTGLPQAVEQAIWAREAEREDETAMRTEQDIIDGWATRGFTIPGGPLYTMLLRARQDTRNKKASLGRDVMIRMHEVLLDQLKFGVAQGLAFEDLFIRIFLQAQQLKLQSAKNAADIAIAVFQAEIEQFRTEADIVRLQLEVKRNQLQIALGQLQGYESYLTGQKLIGELNQQDIAIYEARLSAVKIDAAIYNDEAQVFGTLLGTNKLLLEQARLLVDEELAKLGASAQEIQIWTSGLQGENIKQQAYATRAQTYVAQVGAYSALENVKLENLRAQISQDASDNARFAELIRGYSARLESLRTTGELTVQSNQTLLQGYAAETSGNSAYNSTLIERMRSLVSERQQNTQLLLQNANTNIQNALEAKKVQEQALATATQVLTSIGTSALSGFNVSAGIHDQSSFGYSCNYSTSQSFST